jgi:hypothetical protein
MKDEISQALESVSIQIFRHHKFQLGVFGQYYSFFLLELLKSHLRKLKNAKENKSFYFLIT